MNNKIKIVFVCLGNICRSPAAEGAFKSIVKKKGLVDFFEIDSAGTADYHVGEKPHETTIQVAKERGIIIKHTCRQFLYPDMQNFDYVIPMDNANYRNVYSFARDDSQRRKIMKFRRFDASVKGEPDVPDPYYDALSGFEHVQDIVERSSEGLLQWLLENHNLEVEPAIEDEE